MERGKKIYHFLPKWLNKSMNGKINIRHGNATKKLNAFYENTMLSRKSMQETLETCFFAGFN
ncbi:hypothetical protein D0466_02585 [Peribacillus glennii]|uniref:Uncharacterized protein n=1 Tax=Peribacillus glennii TaxID=2303991 RepID=A0A372LEW2_9BACI|nr:hypothetical protein D0466_02585 [Peribacillus glennii]